jgi:hypothetical protein
LAKGGLQVDWPAMLAQQVRKCLIGEFLKILHAIARQQTGRPTVAGHFTTAVRLAARRLPIRAGGGSRYLSMPRPELVEG